MDEYGQCAWWEHNAIDINCTTSCTTGDRHVLCYSSLDFLSLKGDYLHFFFCIKWKLILTDVVGDTDIVKIQIFKKNEEIRTRYNKIYSSHNKRQSFYLPKTLKNFL